MLQLASFKTLPKEVGVARVQNTLQQPAFRMNRQTSADTTDIQSVGRQESMYFTASRFPGAGKLRRLRLHVRKTRNCEEDVKERVVRCGGVVQQLCEGGSDEKRLV